MTEQTKGQVPVREALHVSVTRTGNMLKCTFSGGHTPTLVDDVWEDVIYEYAYHFHKEMVETGHQVCPVCTEGKSSGTRL